MEINNLYQTFKAFYLACGFKASPVYSFSHTWYYFLNSRYLIFGAIGLIAFVTIYRKRIKKLGRKVKRRLRIFNLEKYNKEVYAN